MNFNMHRQLLKDGFRLRRMTQLHSVMEKAPGMHALSEQIELSKLAGQVVARVTRPFRFSLDFANGRCRIDGDVLVILADEAMQLNRLRQLKPRMLAGLVSSGIPVSDIQFRILPSGRAEPEAYAPPKSEGDSASLFASWEIAEGARRMPEKIRGNFLKIARSLRPADSELRNHMTSRLDAEARGLVESSSEIRRALDSIKAPIPIQFYINHAADADEAQLRRVEEENKAFSECKSACLERMESIKEAAGEAMALSISLKSEALSGSDETTAPIPDKDDEAEFIRVMKRMIRERELCAELLSRPTFLK